MKHVVVDGLPEKTLNPSRHLCEELQELLCHPIWSAAWSCCATPYSWPSTAASTATSCLGPWCDTARPGGGPARTCDLSAAASQGRPKVTGDYHYHYLASLLAGPGAHPDIQDLLASLKARTTPQRARNASERQLFLLRKVDVESVKQALDNKKTRFGAPVWQPCAKYWEHYMLACKRRTSPRRTWQP